MAPPESDIWFVVSLASVIVVLSSTFETREFSACYRY